jgi:hypothetical protein
MKNGLKANAVRKDGLVYQESFVEFSRQMCAEIFERTNRASEDAGVREKK